MSYDEREVVYFTHCGEINADGVLVAARTRCHTGRRNPAWRSHDWKEEKKGLAGSRLRR